MTNYPNGMHPGTIWRKCDFQCHTPRDRNWNGSPNLPGGSEALENARRAWAESFLAACASAKLSAVAITDHHDLCMSRYVLEASTRLDLDIIVYPGIEISCSDNAQLIAVFDPVSTHAQQAMLLARAGGVMPADDVDNTTCKIQATSSTVARIFDAVLGEEHLKDHCVLLPHFSNEDAHKSLNEQGHHPRFAKLQCDGVYIERNHSSLDQTTLEKVQGLIPDWGIRRRAIVATGDNRSASWERLGVHDCWIKLGEPTIEAFRQALLADEARIAYAQPGSPPERIVEIRVQSSLTGPAPVNILFNDGFTAFIGGRGSGKSAFLEYLL